MTLVSLLLGSCVSRDQFEIQIERVTELEEELTRLKNELQNLKSDFDASSRFEREMACQDKLDQLKKRWSNIVGCYYSEYSNTCMVRYEKNGKIEEAKIEDMEDTR